MTTPTGHTTAILASRVKGTAVYSKAGDRIGHVEDIMLDKMSNRIMYAILGFGGFLGVGEKFHPVPWILLNYNEEREGYIMRAEKTQLESAPFYDLDDLVRSDGAWSEAREQSYAHYNVERDWPVS